MSPPEVFSPAAAEEAKEEEDEAVNLSSVLEQLGLSEYLSTFEQEKIDVESLVRASLSLLINLFFFNCTCIHYLSQLVLSSPPTPCSLCAQWMI